MMEGARPRGFRGCGVFVFLGGAGGEVSGRVSPTLQAFSPDLPVTRILFLTLLKACPLPGLTNSSSIISQGSPSIKIFNPGLKSLVE
jgi:hypothetical protein